MILRSLPGMTAFFLLLAAPALAQYGSISDLKVARPEDKVDIEPVAPPPGALILFDGDDLDAWTASDGSPPTWKLVPGGAVEVRPGGGGIKSRHLFDGHYRLHVEFRVPYMPDKQGQARGNSGVYNQGRYEVQVLDSYGLDSQDNDCGGIYEVARPMVNACKAPTVWQSYDIDFRAPVFQEGKKTSPARITVRQNGVLIHENVNINVDNTRAGLGGDPSTPGPLYLQDHGNPVQFRNIWMIPLGD